MHRASELRCRSFLRCVAGVAVADGELLARRCRCMQERGQVQCVRLLEKPGEEGGRMAGFGFWCGLEVTGGRGRGDALLLWGCLFCC